MFVAVKYLNIRNERLTQKSYKVIIEEGIRMQWARIILLILLIYMQDIKI